MHMGGAEVGFLLGMIIFGLVVLGLMIWLVYGTLYKVLSRVPPEYPQMSPGQVFLCLIPLFNIVWLFFVVSRVSGSLETYFSNESEYDYGDCGKSLGLAWAILTVCSIVPLLGMLAALAGVVCMIVYLVKVNGLSHDIVDSYAEGY